MINEVHWELTQGKAGGSWGADTGENVLSYLQFRETDKWKSGGVEVTVGSKEILQQGQSEEMRVFWANRSILLNGIFDPSMPCPLLLQGLFKDGGRVATEAEVLLPIGPYPSICAAPAAVDYHSCPWEV